MKKTTPALIASFLMSLVLGGSMFMIGLDATRTSAAASAAAAALPQGIVNIYTSPASTTSTTLQTVPTPTSITITHTTTRSAASTLLRTSGS